MRGDATVGTRNATGRALVLAAAVLAAGGLLGADGGTQTVGEKLMLDNERVMVFEFVFPPGFRGDEHAAVANEFGYVLDGEFTVITKGRGKRVVKPGEIEYAAKGTVHQSLNEGRTPARVLVVLVKEP
jgi:quercetin dioxygenase-like cupin family protein